jgi:hypothetical protein
LFLFFFDTFDRYTLLARLQSALPQRFGEAVLPNGTSPDILTAQIKRERSVLDPRSFPDAADQLHFWPNQKAAENPNLCSRPLNAASHLITFHSRHGRVSLLNFQLVEEAAFIHFRKEKNNSFLINSLEFF